MFNSGCTRNIFRRRLTLAAVAAGTVATAGLAGAPAATAQPAIPADLSLIHI